MENIQDKDKEKNNNMQDGKDNIYINIANIEKLCEAVELAYKRGCYTMEEIYQLYPVFKETKTQINGIISIINNSK